MTPKEIAEKFVKRDTQALQELDYGFGGPPTESRRLVFVEQRLNDLCAVVMWLCNHIEELEKRDDN